MTKPIDTIAALFITDLAAAILAKEAGAVGDILQSFTTISESEEGVSLSLIKIAAAERFSTADAKGAILIDSVARLLSKSLESLRIGIESGHARSEKAAKTSRKAMLGILVDPDVDPNLPFALLRSFSEAKMEAGAEIASAAACKFDGISSDAGCGGNDPRSIRKTIEAIASGQMRGIPLPEMPKEDPFSFISNEFPGDPYNIHNEVAEQLGALPAQERAAIAISMASSPNQDVRDATIGWLLDKDAVVRTVAREGISALVASGRTGPATARRLSQVVPWIPANERAQAHLILEAAAQSAPDKAPPPKFRVQKILASPLEGSGCQSILLHLRDGARHGIAALLLKKSVGVRDAWMHPRCTKREIEEMLSGAEAKIGQYEMSLSHARASISHFLTYNAENEVPPPFFLAAIAEACGMAPFIPHATSVEDLLHTLLPNLVKDGTKRKEEGAGATERALEASGSWLHTLPVARTWFADDGDSDAILTQCSKKKEDPVTAILNRHIAPRRRWWAEIFAWNAALLPSGDDESTRTKTDLALVAQETLSDRPLNTIPVLVQAAEGTFMCWKAKRSQRRTILL